MFADGLAAINLHKSSRHSPLGMTAALKMKPFLIRIKSLHEIVRTQNFCVNPFSCPFLLYD